MNKRIEGTASNADYLNPPSEEEPQEEAETGRRMDPELRSIAAILRLLEALPEPARERCVVYVSDRYRAENP